MKLFQFSALLGLISSLFLLSCKDSDSKSENTLRKTEIRKLTSADLEKITQFSEEFSTYVSNGKELKISDSYDTRRYFERSFEGIEFPPAEFDKFVKGAERGVKQRPGGLGWGLINQELKFLRIIDFEGMPTPLFRAEGEESVSYIRLMVVPVTTDDEFKIIDMHTLSTGEWASEVTRRLALPFVKNMLGSKFARAFSKDEDAAMAADLEKIKAYNDASQSGDAAQLAAAYQALSPETQKLRYFWSNHLLSLVEDPEAHLAEARKFEAAFPDDSGVAFMLIDADFNRQDWDGALQKIDIVRKEIGGDSYLDHLSATVLIFQEKHQEALEFANNALVKNSQREDAWWNAFTCLIELKENQKFADLMKAYEENFEVALTPDDFNDGILDAFLASPEGKEFFEQK